MVGHIWYFRFSRANINFGSVWEARKWRFWNKLRLTISGSSHWLFFICWNSRYAWNDLFNPWVRPIKTDKNVVKYVQNIDFSTSKYHRWIRLNLTISGSFHGPEKVDWNVIYGRFTSKNTSFSPKKLRKIGKKSYLKIFPWVWFNWTQKWVPRHPNNRVKRNSGFVHPKNWDSLSKHTWGELLYIGDFASSF